MSPELAHAYNAARAITRTYARTFYFASWLLPPTQRRHAYAIYAFCRTVDSLVDDQSPDTPPTQIMAQLDALERLITDPSAADYPWAAAFVDTRKALQIPSEPFLELLKGVKMDLNQNRYPSFEALRIYCYRVAGVVGHMLCYVFGLRDQTSLAYAEKLGIAMQLTNILRDVGEDWARGRVYLPQAELERYGYTEAALAQRQADAAYVALIRAEISRARTFYQEGAQGIARLPSSLIRATVILMARLYEGILDKIALNPTANLHQRLSLSYAEKLALGLQALLGLSPIGQPSWPSPYRTALIAFLLMTPVAIGFILWQPWPALRLWSDSLYLATWALLGLFVLTYQNRPNQRWVALSVGLGLAIEAVGVATGWPFGTYQYTAYLQPQVAGVPLSIALAWAAIVGGFAVLAPSKLRPLYTAVGAMSIDLLLEPFATEIMHYWSWQSPTIPPQNYFAWGAIAAILSFFSRKNRISQNFIINMREKLSAESSSQR